MNIHEYIRKIKSLGRRGEEPEFEEFDENGEIIKFPIFRKVFLALVIILIASLSFGLGKLSNLNQREPVRIEYGSLQTTDNPQPTANINTENWGVVASKNGTKYHYSYCSGAKQIKEENKISFATALLAESAGYTLATNCKPQ